MTRIATASGHLFCSIPSNLSVEPTVFYQDIRTGGMSAYDSAPGTTGALSAVRHLGTVEATDSCSPACRSRMTLAGSRSPRCRDTGSAIKSNCKTERSRSRSLFGTPSFDPALGGIGPAQLFETDDTHQFSTELRVASTGTERLKWLVGGVLQRLLHPVSARSRVGSGRRRLSSVVPDLFTGELATDIKQKAAFGNLIYQITPKLKAEVGLRYFSYDDTTTLTTGGVVYGDVPPAPPAGGDGRRHGFGPESHVQSRLLADLERHDLRDCLEGLPGRRWQLPHTNRQFQPNWSRLFGESSGDWPE